MYQKTLLISFLATSALAQFPIPSSQGSVTFDEPHEVAAGETFDGGLKTYGRGIECTGQSEGGQSDTVFVVQEGGSLKNAIIGADQKEGVYCLGACTIENVWWEAVCEDALSLKGGNGPYNIIGGGAQGADDKVIQHNSGGQVNIDGFTVYDFGKLYRSCGNCKEQFARTVSITNVIANSGKTLVGINSNLGDTASIDGKTCATSVKKICVEYEGNDNGDEPEQIGEGPSDACQYSDPLPSC